MGSHQIWAEAPSDSLYMDKGEVFRRLNDSLLTNDAEMSQTNFQPQKCSGYMQSLGRFILKQSLYHLISTLQVWKPYII